MKVARGIAARSFEYWHDRWETPHNGLVCIRCDAFFRTATLFTQHNCWDNFRDTVMRKRMTEALLNRRPKPAEKPKDHNSEQLKLL